MNNLTNITIAFSLKPLPTPLSNIIFPEQCFLSHLCLIQKSTMAPYNHKTVNFLMCQSTTPSSFYTSQYIHSSECLACSECVHSRIPLPIPASPLIIPGHFDVYLCLETQENCTSPFPSSHFQRPMLLYGILIQFRALTLCFPARWRATYLQGS